MGLRCLLGHDFGPPEMEREREENGDEMVVTVREIETCRRCGEERVVSENKEVTAIRSPDEVDLDDDTGASEVTDAPDPGSDAPDTTAETTTPDAPDADGVDLSPEGSDDGVILDDEADERGHGEWPDADETTATESATRVDAAAEAISEANAGGADGNEDDASTDVADVAAEEGAELIDADGDADEPDESADAADPAAEERPDAAAASTGAAESWPDPEGTDEGFDAGQATGGGPADVTFGGGLAPDTSAESTPTDRGRGEYVGVDEEDGDEFDDMVRADSDVDEDADATEFFCPNCGLSQRAGETSMRVGDICPSCHKGYVAERNA